MFWNVMTSLMDSDEWGPIPDDGWMAPGKDTTPPPPPPPDPDGGTDGGDGGAALRRRSHKEDAPIDTPEIQGEEE
jgi:hypothetical protein